MNREVTVVDKEQAQLGEGPVWNKANKSLYWLDIIACKLHRFDTQSQKKVTYEMPSMAGCYAFGTDGLIYVFLEDGLYSFDESSEEFVAYVKPKELEADFRFNDGKCDPMGRFVVGSMDKAFTQGKSHKGSLYKMDHKSDSKVLLSKAISIPNGLAWNEAKDTFYHVRTIEHKVYAYDYDNETGDISGSRVVIELGGNDGVPDGMTIDREGMLWIAHWGGYKVSRWDPRTGKRLDEIPVPAQNVTSCVFGGKDMDELFITSANEATDEVSGQENLNGCVFRVKLEVAGMELNQFSPNAN